MSTRVTRPPVGSFDGVRVDSEHLRVRRAHPCLAVLVVFAVVLLVPGDHQQAVVGLCAGGRRRTGCSSARHRPGVAEDELALDPLLRAWASASAGSSSERVRRTGPAACFLKNVDISTSTAAAALAVSHVRPRIAMY